MVLIKAISDSLCHNNRPMNRLMLMSWRSTSWVINRSHPNLFSVHRYFATAPIISPNDEGNSVTYELYQYKICPFSNIAKAVLKYQQIPYRSIEVNPLTKAELKFSKEYRKVPIVLSVVSTPSNTDQPEQSQHQPQQQQFNGTEEILAHFASHHHHLHDYDDNNNSNNDDDFASSPSSIRWQDFARSRLAPLLYPNLCRTLSSSFRAFDYVHDSDSPFTPVQRYSIQYVGSVAMYLAASKIKKKYQIDDVRLALDGAMEELEAGLTSSSEDGSRHTKDSNSVTFLRRQQRQQQQQPSSSESSSSSSSSLLPPQPPQPHLGDLAVYGVLKGLEGLPIFDEIMTDPRFLRIQTWYSAMDELVSKEGVKKESVRTP